MPLTYFLQQDSLPLGEIASVLADGESFVRHSIDDVERRIYMSRALSLLVEQMAAGYALASVRAGARPSEAATWGVAIESCRQQIASVVGMTVVESSHSNVTTMRSSHKRLRATCCFRGTAYQWLWSLG